MKLKLFPWLEEGLDSIKEKEQIII